VDPVVILIAPKVVLHLWENLGSPYDYVNSELFFRKRTHFVHHEVFIYLFIQAFIHSLFINLFIHPSIHSLLKSRAVLYVITLLHGLDLTDGLALKFPFLFSHH